MHSMVIHSLAVVMIFVASIGSCDQRSAPARQQASEKGTTTVYLVRHAEKGQGDDPSLTEEGQARARALATRLKDAHIQQIFATDTRRTQQTVAPLAKKLKLRVQVVSAEDIQGMVDRIESHPGQNILVAAHSNTIGPIIEGLGGEAIDAIDEEEFDHLYIVKITSSGEVTVKQERYGSPDDE